MAAQKFQRGDLVKIANDLGPSMSHFDAGIEAIVTGSYADQYGGDDTRSYTLHLGPTRGECSWYHEEQLTLIEPGAVDLLRQWEQLRREMLDRDSDIDWIFANGARMVAEGKCPGASLQALFGMLGGGSMWGTNGEGVTWYANAQAVISRALPYLSRGDRAGWEVYCREFAEGKHP